MDLIKSFVGVVMLMTNALPVNPPVQNEGRQAMQDCLSDWKALRKVCQWVQRQDWERLQSQHVCSGVFVSLLSCSWPVGICWFVSLHLNSAYWSVVSFGLSILQVAVVMWCLHLHCRILDNLPVAVVRKRSEGVTYDRGFPIGFKASYETVSSDVSIVLKCCFSLLFPIGTQVCWWTELWCISELFGPSRRATRKRSTSSSITLALLCCIIRTLKPLGLLGLRWPLWGMSFVMFYEHVLCSSLEVGHFASFWSHLWNSGNLNNWQQILKHLGQIKELWITLHEKLTHLEVWYNPIWPY